VSTSDFRQIAIRNELGKGERLFRAAVTAFCSLTRPSRREIAQLEDLTLPLFDSVSDDSLRYVAAALSENSFAPPALVRRLCEEPADIAAPLLMRSAALSDVDLIALIGRHGQAHARAVALRSHLSPVIAGLVRALETAKPDEPSVPASQSAVVTSGKPDPMLEFDLPPLVSGQPGSDAVEAVRERLRAMMRPEPALGVTAVQSPLFDPYPKLRETALTGHLPFFQTALADATGVDFGVVRKITEGSSYASLAIALRAIELSEERAFVLVAAIFPESFRHSDAIRLFLERYRLIHPAAASDRLRDWKAEAIDTISTGIAVSRPANNDVEDEYDWSAEAELKAS